MANKSLFKWQKVCSILHSTVSISHIWHNSKCTEDKYRLMQNKQKSKNMEKWH